MHGRFDDAGWWLCSRTPLGPATLHLRRSDAGIHASAWGDGAEWILGRVPDLVGVHDDPRAFQPDHSLLADLARRRPGIRFGATGLVFDALLVAILTQKVTGKEAYRSLGLLRRDFSDPAPGPKPMRLLPDPERLAGTPYWDLHRIGLEKRRADIVVGAARRFHEIQGLVDVPPAEAQRVLGRQRGIGPWTAAETVAVSHGDADALSVGDYHLKNLVAWHMRGSPRGTDEEMVATLEPFRPHRGRVIRLLETLGHAPAFGHRMPLRDIASI